MPVRPLIFIALLLLPLVAWTDGLTVRLNGLDGDLKTNAQVLLGLSALEGRTDLSEAAIRRIHRRAPGQIQKALQPFGFYDAKITRTLKPDPDGNWVATYTVDPGESVKLRNVTIKLNGPGKDETTIVKALAEYPLRPGDQLLHDNYKNLKTALRRAAFNRGYLDATFSTHTMQVDPTQKTADIELILETGPRFSFGRITIEQVALSESLINRYVGIVEGQAYEQSKLLDVQYALQDSGFFAAVEVTAEREQAENLHVPIHIRTISRKPQRYSAGIGYASDAGPRTSLGWENRLVNSRGHQANIDLRVSQTKNDFSTRYSVPIGDPRSERFVWSFAHRTENLGDDTESRRQELGASQTKVNGEWQRNLYLQLTHEISLIADTRSTDTLLLPGISYSRSRNDSPVQPRSASRLSSDLRGSHQTLGSDTDFLRLKLETRLIRPLGRGRLLLRGDFGTTVVSEFSSLPASQRFFAGGDRSVRGFGFNELGPRDANDLNIGGQHFVSGSVEIEWPIVGRFSTALFVDAGNAFDSFSDELEYSVGIGGRILTPIGVIRVDLAKPVTEGGKSFRLHIGLGPDL